MIYEYALTLEVKKMYRQALTVYQILQALDPKTAAHAMNCCKHSCTLGLIENAEKYLKLSEELIEKDSPNVKLV